MPCTPRILMLCPLVFAHVNCAFDQASLTPFGIEWHAQALQSLPLLAGLRTAVMHPWSCLRREQTLCRTLSLTRHGPRTVRGDSFNPAGSWTALMRMLSASEGDEEAIVHACRAIKHCSLAGKWTGVHNASTTNSSNACCSRPACLCSLIIARSSGFPACREGHAGLQLLCTSPDLLLPLAQTRPPPGSCSLLDALPALHARPAAGARGLNAGIGARCGLGAPSS